MNDKREHTRINFDTRVIIKTDTDKLSVKAGLQNLSLKGMFVKSKKKITGNSTCHIKIILSGSSAQLCLKMGGTILYNLEDGFGVRFDSIDPDSYFHLKNIIMYNCPVPDSALKEMFF